SERTAVIRLPALFGTEQRAAVTTPRSVDDVAALVVQRDATEDAHGTLGGDARPRLGRIREVHEIEQPGHRQHVTAGAERRVVLTLERVAEVEPRLEILHAERVVLARGEVETEVVRLVGARAHRERAEVHDGKARRRGAEALLELREAVGTP